MLSCSHNQASLQSLSRTLPAALPSRHRPSGQTHPRPLLPEGHGLCQGLCSTRERRPQPQAGNRETLSLGEGAHLTDAIPGFWISPSPSPPRPDLQARGGRDPGERRCLAAANRWVWLGISTARRTPSPTATPDSGCSVVQSSARQRGHSSFSRELSCCSPGSAAQLSGDCSTRETPPVKKAQGFPFGLQPGRGHALYSTSTGPVLGGCCHGDRPLFLCVARASSHHLRFCSHLSGSRRPVLVRERKSARVWQRPIPATPLQPPPLTFHLRVGWEKGSQKPASRQGAKGPLDIMARRCLLRAC